MHSLGGFRAHLATPDVVVGILYFFSGSFAQPIHQLSVVLRDWGMVVASQILADGADDGVYILGIFQLRSRTFGVEEQVTGLEFTWK